MTEQQKNFIKTALTIVAITLVYFAVVAIAATLLTPRPQGYQLYRNR